MALRKPGSNTIYSPVFAPVYTPLGIGGFAGIYDGFESSMVASYSLRRTLASYDGPCIQIEDSFDGVDYDIGFDVNGDVDIADAESKVTGTGSINIWYDQKGSNDLVKSEVADSIRVIVSGSWLADAPQFSGTEYLFKAANPGISAFPFSHVTWSRTTTSGTFNQMASLSDQTDVTSQSRFGSRYGSPAGKHEAVFRGTANEDVSGTAGLNDGAWRMFSQAVTSAQNQGFLNAVSEGTNAHGATMWTPDRITIGAMILNGGAQDFLVSGSVSEFILFDADMASSMAAIHAFGRPLA